MSYTVPTAELRLYKCKGKMEWARCSRMLLSMVWSVDGRGVIEVISLHTHEERDSKIGNVRTA